MPYRTTKRRGSRRGLLALACATACSAPFAFASPASATLDTFCPATPGYITLGGYTGCTNTVQHWLRAVIYANNLNAAWHCAVGKAGPQADGASSNVMPAACGYGVDRYGTLIATPGGGPVLGYARGTNEEPYSVSGYYGVKEY